MKNKIYIAGPMTGLPDYNFKAFNEAEHKLTGIGWEVVNPASHGVIEGYEWQDYLRLDIKKMMDCGAVYLLKNWHKSKGANLEYKIAKDLDMLMLFEGIHYENDL